MGEQKNLASGTPSSKKEKAGHGYFLWGHKERRRRKPSRGKKARFGYSWGGVVVPASAKKREKEQNASIHREELQR